MSPLTPHLHATPLLKRVKKQREFAAIKASPFKAIRPAFILQWCPAHLQGPNEIDKKSFGIIASRRVGGAVERNRAKRRLRVIAGKILGKAPCGSYLLIARTAILSKQFDELLKEAEGAIKVLKMKSSQSAC